MPFPTTPILDAFNRANEDPAVGWSVMTGIDDMRVVSNKLTGGGTTWSGSSYDGLVFTVPMEMYVTNVFGMGSGGVQEINYLCRDATSGLKPNDGNRNGYALITNLTVVDEITLNRLDAGVSTTVHEWAISGGGIDVGDSFGIYVDSNNFHHLYFKHTTGAWIEQGVPIQDATYTSGFGTLQTDGNGTAEWDDFGGGTPVVLDAGPKLIVMQANRQAW
jgi:hypothetical protein